MNLMVPLGPIGPIGTWTLGPMDPIGTFGPTGPWALLGPIYDMSIILLIINI